MKKLVITLGLVLTTIAACSSSSTDTGSSSGTSGTGTMDAATPANNIVVKSNVFEPSTLNIKVGDTVTWTWAGGAHTVTSGANCMSDNAYGTPGLQSTVGATFTHTYDKAGTFEFFCMPHCVSSGMKGSIVVK